MQSVSCRVAETDVYHQGEGRVSAAWERGVQVIRLNPGIPTNRLFSRNRSTYLKMFKRVDKRRRKKEEEEKLGLDEEVKEILGIHDTDSEESESDSDSDEGEEEEEEEEESVADDEENFGEEDVDDEEDDDEEEKKEDPSITVSQALKDPLYVVSVLPDMKACIVCPDKLLKSLKMVQLHRTSNACTLSLIYKKLTLSAHLLFFKFFFCLEKHKILLGPYTSF